MKIIGALLLAAAFSGCVAKNTYRIEFQYVNPIQNGESRQVNGYVSGEGFTSNAILVEFPRTLKLIDEEYVSKRGAK